MRDSTKIRQEISRLYDKNPQGWGVLVGKDPHGFYDMLISHGTEAWQVKEYQVNPYKFVGLGSRLSIPSANTLAGAQYPFGLRPIGAADIKELTSIIDDPRGMNDLAAKLLTRKPVSSSEASEAPAILHGPILHSGRPLEALSPAHTRLDERLRKELRRIVNRDFRQTLTPYI